MNETKGDNLAQAWAERLRKGGLAELRGLAARRESVKNAKIDKPPQTDTIESESGIF